MSPNRILTTHAGSLPRPARLVELYAARVAGEAVDEAELVRTYELFVAVWQLGQSLLESGEATEDLLGACRAKKDQLENVTFANSSQPDRSEVLTDPHYVIRSWMAVFTYLLSDAQFLFE